MVKVSSPNRGHQGAFKTPINLDKTLEFREHFEREEADEARRGIEFSLGEFARHSFDVEYVGLSLRSLSSPDPRKVLDEEQSFEGSSLVSNELQGYFEPKEGSTDAEMHNTLVGVGLILFVVQAAIMAATFISASPDWNQLDPLAVTDGTRTKKSKPNENNEADKLFE